MSFDKKESRLWGPRIQFGKKCRWRRFKDHRYNTSTKNSICGFSTNFKQICLFFSPLKTKLKKCIVLNITVKLSVVLKLVSFIG